MEQVKKFTPALFAVIMFCFFLPFINISCGGQTIISLTGFQLITGSEYDQSKMFGDNMFNQDMNNQQAKPERIEPQIFALLAFIAALLALIISFIRKKTAAFLCMISCILGFIFLLVLKFKLDGDASMNGEGMLQIEYLFAYWFSFILFIAGAFLQWNAFSQKTIQPNVFEDPKAV